MKTLGILNILAILAIPSTAVAADVDVKQNLQRAKLALDVFDKDKNLIMIEVYDLPHIVVMTKTLACGFTKGYHEITAMCTDTRAEGIIYDRTVSCRYNDRQIITLVDTEKDETFHVVWSCVGDPEEA